MTARDGQASPGSAENPLPPVEACRRKINPKKTKRALLKWLAAAGTGAVLATTLISIPCCGGGDMQNNPFLTKHAVGVGEPTASQPATSAATQPTSEPTSRPVRLEGKPASAELHKPS